MKEENIFKHGEKVIVIFNIFPNTFRSVDEIEVWLSDSLRAKGLQGSKTKLLPSGRLLDIYIRPVDIMLEATYKQIPGRPLSIGSKLKRLSEHKETAAERDFKRGKMLVRKGYLKRG